MKDYSFVIIQKYQRQTKSFSLFYFISSGMNSLVTNMDIH